MSLSFVEQELPVVKLHGGIVRGATLDYDPPGNVMGPALLSCHENAKEAIEAFLAIPHHLDREAAHYKVHCHQLDAQLDQ